MQRARANLVDCSNVTWDVVVIGAGPAGALAARQLAIGGSRVLLLDRKSFPRTKVCGACINGQATATLDRVGLSHVIDRLDSVPLRRFQLWSGGSNVQMPLPAGVALSRKRFDAALVQAAQTAGVQFLDETSALVGDITCEHRLVRLTQGARTAVTRARAVVVADGLGHPSLAGRREFQARRSAHSHVGCGACIDQSPDYFIGGVIYMAVGTGGYVGLVRQEDGSLNAAAALDPKLIVTHGGPARLAGMVLEEAGIPHNAAVANAEWHATPRLTQRPRRVAGSRLFLIGDAAGYVEPFTGQGIAWALESAVVVAPLVRQAVTAWRDELVGAWHDTHRRVISSSQGLSRIFATGLRSPAFVRTGIRVAAWLPSIAQWVVGKLNAPTALPVGNCAT